MTRMPVLEARNLVMVLGEGAGQVRALKGVSLTVYPGELTLLMGPSGSGKTTLLSILGCILSATSGSLRLLGHEVQGRSPGQLAALRREHVGFVFQSYNLFPTLTAFDNVQLALDVQGMAVSERCGRAEAALASVGLTPKRRSYPRALSGGEKQRVAIARALAASPSIILADEPTSALDAENGAAVMALLASIAHKDGRAVLAVTHDAKTAAFADRIVHIEDGRIGGEERPKRHREDVHAKASAGKQKANV